MSKGDVPIGSLTELSSPASTDLLMVVTDPSGTPVSNKATISNVVGTISPVHALLHDEILASSGSFDVSGISQDYDDLLIRLKARGTNAAVECYTSMHFNNDADNAHYHYQAFYLSDGTSLSGQESNEARCGYAPAATSPANFFTDYELYIMDYTNTDYLKEAQAEQHIFREVGRTYVWQSNLIWINGGTAAINRIAVQNLSDPAEKLIAGSRLRIYGVKYT